MGDKVKQIVEEIKKNSSVFIVNPASSLQDTINNTIEQLIKKDKFVCIYISFTKTEKKMEQVCDEREIGKNQIFFVYFGTEPSKKESEWLTHSIHVPSPQALSSIGIAVDALTQLVKEKGIVMVDCLSIMLIYNQINMVAKFVKGLMDRCTEHKLKIVVFTTKSEQKLLEEKVSVFFDKAIMDDGD